MADFEPNVISVTAAAREKGCSRQHIYNLLAGGELRSVDVGGTTMVARDDAYEALTVPDAGGRLHQRFISKTDSDDGDSKD